MDVTALNINSLATGASSKNSVSKNQHNQLEALQKEIENYKKQLQEIDKQDISNESKDAKRKMIQEKISALSEEITKLQTEQAKEALNKQMKTSAKKNMSKEEYTSMKLIEAGVSLELSQSLSTLEARIKSDYNRNKSYLEKDQEYRTYEVIEAKDVRRTSGSDGLTEDERREAAWNAIEKTARELGVFEEAEDKIREDFEQMDFSDPTPGYLIDPDKLIQLYDEYRTLGNVRNQMDTKQSFLEQLVTKGGLAVLRLEDGSLGQVAKANAAINDIQNSAESEQSASNGTQNEVDEEALTEEVHNSVDIQL